LPTGSDSSIGVAVLTVVQLNVPDSVPPEGASSVSVNVDADDPKGFEPDTSTVMVPAETTKALVTPVYVSVYPDADRPEQEDPSTV
jgi:hypothetical protein